MTPNSPSTRTATAAAAQPYVARLRRDMDGVHDMGGMHGFGPIRPTPQEPPFHQPWEGRVHGMVIAASVAGVGLPYGRPYQERLDAAIYLTVPYYQRWLLSLEQRLTAIGAVTRDEVDAYEARIALHRREPATSNPELAERCQAVLRPFEVVDPSEPVHRFAVGDRVRARRDHPAGHTRLPRYVRGVTGSVLALRPPQLVLDAVAQGEDVVEPQYSVIFRPTDLWGDDTEPGRGSVVVDLWERHLEAA